MMTFHDLLRNRRSIRDFQQKDVPLETIKDIIKDSCLAPSASNGQPCNFIIIKNRDMMKKISDECKKNLLNDFANSPGALKEQYEAILKDEKFNIFYNASCVIYVAGSSDVHSLDVDCALAVGYLMFSAAQRGLGTCWIGFGTNIRDPKIKEEIGLPDNYSIVAPLVIGYPQAIPAPLERKEPQILKIIS
jgi:nitroreductase